MIGIKKINKSTANTLIKTLKVNPLSKTVEKSSNKQTPGTVVNNKVKLEKKVQTAGGWKQQNKIANQKTRNKSPK